MMWQSLRRSAQRKFGNSEFMQMKSGNFQTPAGVYKVTLCHSHTVSGVRNFWPSATITIICNCFILLKSLLHHKYQVNGHKHN